MRNPSDVRQCGTVCERGGKAAEHWGRIDDVRDEPARAIERHQIGGTVALARHHEYAAILESCIGDERISDHYGGHTIRQREDLCLVKIDPDGIRSRLSHSHRGCQDETARCSPAVPGQSRHRVLQRAFKKAARRAADLHDSTLTANW